MMRSGQFKKINGKIIELDARDDEKNDGWKEREKGL
jgi:hypothetical protein